MRHDLDHDARYGYRMIGVVLASTLLIVGIFALLAPAASAGAAAAYAASGQYGDKPGSAGPDSVTATCPANGQCFADVPPGNPFFDYTNNLYKQNIVGGYACVNGTAEPCDSANRPYFRWTSNVTRGQLTKFVDNARTQPGIVISGSAVLNPLIAVTSAPGYSAIQARSVSGPGLSVSSEQTFAIHAGAGGGNPAVLAENSSNGNGVSGHGVANLAYGVYGYNTGSGWGVGAYSANGTGLYAQAATSGNAIYAASASGNGVVGLASSGAYAIYATGDLRVTGVCDGCALATYKIDDPADPSNKYLNQAAMVSSEYLNVYSGNATLDAQGQATVRLPAWVATVNKDFRYQLTAIGASALVYVAEKVSGNQFKIAGGKPGMEVSWQLTGVRNDRYSVANPLQVEQVKPAAEKGTYWQPGLYGQPASKGIAATVKP